MSNLDKNDANKTDRNSVENGGLNLGEILENLKNSNASHNNNSTSNENAPETEKERMGTWLLYAMCSLCCHVGRKNWNAYKKISSVYSRRQ